MALAMMSETQTVDHHIRVVETSCRPLIVLVGPTAIGKSHVAIEVAKTLGTEVLTADSTQVYPRHGSNDRVTDQVVASRGRAWSI